MKWKELNKDSIFYLTCAMPLSGLSGDQRLVEVQKCLQNDRQLMSPIKSPGAFSHIYVRLYENFAQVHIVNITNVYYCIVLCIYF